MTSRRSQLDRVLAAVGRRWLCCEVLRALLRVTLVMLPTAGILCVMDSTLRFSTATRQVGRAVLLAVPAAALAWFLLRLIRRRSPYASALRIEEVDSRFGGRLVSCVDFRSRPPSAWRGASAEMVGALCEGVEQQAGDIDPCRVIPSYSLYKPLSGLAGLAVGAALLICLAPQAAWTWARRTIQPAAAIEWPARSTITGLADRYRVRRGDTLRIAGRITGRVPSTGSLEEWPTRPGGGLDDAPGAGRALPVGPDGRFDATLGPLFEPAAFRIRAGDATTRKIVIDVVIPPTLASLEAVCHYPEFLNVPPRRLATPDIRALVGTRVDLAVEADRPVELMTLLLAGASGQSERPVELVSPTRGTASFHVRFRGFYAVRLEGAGGVAADEPATYMIEPVQNETPVVSLRRPAGQAYVTPGATVPFEFEAIDDLGFESVDLVWQRRPAGAAAADPPARTTIPLGGPTRVLRGPWRWNLAETGARPGDEIRCHLEAVDAGEHLLAAASRPSRSAEAVLLVVDPAAFVQRHQDRLAAAFDEIDEVGRGVATGWDEVSAMLRLDDEAMARQAADLGRRLGHERDRQARLVQQTSGLVDRLNRMLAEWRDSVPESRPGPQGTERLAETLSALAQGAMADAQAGLEEAARLATTGPPGSPLRAPLGRTHRAQASALSGLAKLSAARPMQRQEASPGGISAAEARQAFDRSQAILARALKALPAGTKTPRGEGSAAALMAERGMRAAPGGPGRPGGKAGGGAAPGAGATAITGGPETLPATVAGEGAAAGPAWRWIVPPRDRAVVRQAMAEPFPPGQARAIRRYYERLSKAMGNRP